MDSFELARLTTCIEENLRASTSTGLQFVDARHHQTRLASKQNHVVFGRRGAGKTTLVKAIRESGDPIYVYLNLEDYKDITFPNTIIHVLSELLVALAASVSNSLKWYKPWKRIDRRLVRELRQTASGLRKQLHSPDSETFGLTEKEAQQNERGGKVEREGVGISARRLRNSEREVVRQVPRSKIEYLRIELTNFKSLLSRVSNSLEGRPIFLILDDFYFISKDTQPDFIDYFHRLTKGTDLFLKVATIKHRSKLYRRPKGQYIGVELGHDIFEVDMDYTLDKFAELQTFMQRLLDNAREAAGVTGMVDELFVGDGFLQLCLASGGVPRDFLSLFVNLASQSSDSGAPIGKVEVTQAAITNIDSKMESMKMDSGDEDSLLLDCLTHVKRHVYTEKRTNAFLVSKDELAKNLQAQQAIRELVDLRLIHLVDENISKAPSDGLRYEAYILDIGLYDNSRPRNFNQVDPGHRDERSRKDELRSSPVFRLDTLKEPLPKHVRNIRGETDPKDHPPQLSLSFE